jgi:hypothetical protein
LRRQLVPIAVAMALAASGVGLWSSSSGSSSARASLVAEAWPGDATVTTASVLNQFGTDLSGLYYEAGATTGEGTLWAVRNDGGFLYKLRRDGAVWVPATDGGWAAGKTLANVSGTVGPDAEGVTMTAAGASGGLYVASERSNANKSRSRLSVLRYDVTGTSGSLLNATREWDLTGDLPAVDSNKGLESVAWVPDAELTASGFLDERTGAAYEPEDYPEHGAGLFFVGLETGGTVYAYALNQTSAQYTRVATIPIPGQSGIGSVMELQWDADRHLLWAACDNGCTGRVATYQVATSGPDAGKFVINHVYVRPGGMIDTNNEGFAFAPDADCVGGRKSVWWSDDDQAAGYSLRAGTMVCEDPESPEPEPSSTPTAEPTEQPTEQPTASDSPPAAEADEPQPTSSPSTSVTARAAVSVKALNARKIRVDVKVRGTGAPEYSGRIRVRVRGLRGAFIARARHGSGVVRLGARLEGSRRARLTVTVPARVIRTKQTTFFIARTVETRTLRLR